MSGHSRWTQIKRGKGIADAKRSALFTKLGNTITVAARELGGEPAANFKLRMAIEQAKAVNMPKDNIERAIKRGTGELAGAQIEEITYEVFGPKGTAFIIEILTDNKNRAIANLKHILTKYEGGLGTSGSVVWRFEKRGVIRMTDAKNQDLELRIIDAGAEDIKRENETLIIYTKSEDLQKVKENLEKQEITIEYAGVEWVAKEPIKIGDTALKEKLEKLYQELDDSEDVNNYYSNTEF